MITILIVISVISMYISDNEYNERFSNPENIEIVVARYNEDLEWLKEEPFNHYDVIIYNKGVNEEFYKPPLLKEVIRLPNTGVCDHTYLYHIIKNYDNLSNITIFLPGSCMDPHKKEQTMKTVYKAIETNNTVFYGRYIEEENEIYNFSLNNWETTNEKNKEINPDSALRPCDIRPFGKWIKTVLPNEDIKYIVNGGIFAVSSNHIKTRSKEKYQELLGYVNKNKNEECSHYLERSYITLFLHDTANNKEYIYL